MIRLDGKVMLVTGGTSGIGLATARLAHALGARVAVSGRREDRGHQALAALGPEAICIRADVMVEDDVRRMIASAVDRFGRLDVLVNGAGAIRRVPVMEEEASGWDQTLALHLRGVFLCCKYALPHLIATRGAIVNVSSVLAFRTPQGRTPAYEAAKAGVLALTRAIAVHHGPDGVRANAVCPGFVPTELNRSVWEAWTEAQRAAMVRTYPLRRLGTPDDVARAIVFLASDAAGWISGEALRVDGGRSAADLRPIPPGG
ncbi:MAG: SDR family NAD(P)-dependent oxidoreductase [Armatimonadota bacterium]|nr:SDR family NAD(P)-dependent oxidoreductase [Armatimonadota bacterium]MDR7519808.1 SDR family NAD(P)-dependent oxidoreductase [Armatimonadota bacterium]MDR7549573.1 SDR family NAD(P)-dependent oxidoreductase [Armatimonadota bacterium]